MYYPMIRVIPNVDVYLQSGGIYTQIWGIYQKRIYVIDLAYSAVDNFGTIPAPYHLCDLITERLNKKYTNPAPPIPSVEWICLQFRPSNPYSDKALQYTGRF